MAPGPQEQTLQWVPAGGRGDAPPADSAIVVSGMSGLLPGCHNVAEFAEKLYNKETLLKSREKLENMVQKYEPRWMFEHPEVPEHYGRVPGLDRMDAQFFMVHHRLCHTLDAMARKVLENTYQAIYDAGMSPAELSTKRVAVFIAVSNTETEKGCAFAEVGFGLMGCNRAMIANRVSYWLNVKGPSIVVDASCCGSMVVFEKAYQAIESGECDAAIVGAGKVLLHPQSLIHYHRLVPANKDGKTKCYDTNADGQSISEAINVFLLQKYKDSKRVYASLCNIETQFGVVDNGEYAEKFGHFRDPKRFAKFIQEFYRKAGIPPSLVEYVEGFGAAVPEIDKMELQAIEEVFCKDRSSPLLVGSVMSNIGYTDAASGSSAMMKVLLAYHRGELAANLHCDSPRQDIEALREGRVRIVTEHQRFKRSFAAVNGMSVIGLNAHALLQGCYKPKDLSRYHSEIPYLVTVSGRQESGVQKLLDHLKSRKLDAEEIALLHNIHKYRINGHLARGFGIFSTNEDNETITHREEADYYDDAKRPLWFVYSGMGSQWAGMGTQLMRIPIFAAAIERCQKVLEPKGVDLINILTSPDKTVYDNILNSFVGIAAVQIGLTDVLTSIGLVPDKIIGHSVGELGCAYADGCLTAEEMILASYSRGLVSLETPLIAGAMAAVGLGFEKIKSMCPPEIEVACHNGPESSTISGPAVVMSEFVAHLTSKGIFAKEVLCSNIAYHSRYIAKAGPGLLQYLSKVITTPKLRSERWVSTSVPQDRWHEHDAKYSSAEYHTNNLLSPVLFEETIRLVPSNAVVVEIAPHGLLQAILKKSLPASCKNIALTQRGHADNTLFLLEAIGRIYLNGYEPDVAALYPQVEFPVSTETPMLSHLVEWVYAEQWNLCLVSAAIKNYSAVYKPIVTIFDEEYLAGHIIEGSRYYPFAGALVLVWDTLAMSMSKPRSSISVQYRDIHFHVQPCLLDDEALHLTVAIQKGSGRFEVSYEHGLIAEGTIVTVSGRSSTLELDSDDNEAFLLPSNDIYKLLHERGYEYKGDFRSIRKTSMSFNRAELIWKCNWVTFIDGLIQLNAIKRRHTAVSQPTHIKSLTVRPKDHLIKTRSAEYIEAKLFEQQEITQCGGVRIEKVTFIDKPSIVQQSVGLKTLQFFPFFLEEDENILTTLYIFMQIILENIADEKINICDIICCNKTSIIEKLKKLMKCPPEIKHEVLRIQKSELLMFKNKKPKPDVVILNDLLSDKRMFEILFHSLPPNTFIVSIGVETEGLPAALYRPVCVRGKGPKKIELVLWRPSASTSTTSLTVRNPSEIDFLQSTCSNLPQQHSIFVLTSYPPPLGLKEIVKQQKKVCSRKINVAMIKDKLDDVQTLDQFPSLNLSYNLLDDGKWGGEYYIPLPKSAASGRPVALQSTEIGNLDSLKWVEVPESIKEGVTVTVHYAALNTYDAKLARGEIPITNITKGYGMDFSGMTESGDRVFGVLPKGAVSSRVNVKPEYLWPVPDHWDLEDAATVPLPYLQAFYCFFIKTQIRQGMRVLIHGGAGALGQALISIALAIHCEVFTTVSDIRKKKFLNQLFPNLKGSNIGNSRDNSFCDMVLCATKGAGCDIIINCLQGELKNASLSCCAALGTTLDVCQIHTRENFTYRMYNMTGSRSYVPIDFSQITASNNFGQYQKLQLLVSDGIAKGYVRPLSRVTYSPHEAARAFRLLAGSNHRGRVLLRLSEPALASLAQPRLACSPEMQQLLICDEEVFSLQLVDRLIDRGAKKLRMYFQRPSAYLDVKIAAWHQRGIQVDTTFGQIWNKEELVKFLHESNRTGDVEALFIIVKDYEHTSIMEATLRTLDVVSRELLPSLKHFTIISEERIIGRDVCCNRKYNGLPSLTLQLQKLDEFDEIGLSNTDEVSNHYLKWPIAVDIVEKALCSRKTVVFGYAKTKTHRTLLEDLALMPGVSITSSTDQRSTLEQVGVDQGRAQELCYLLAKKCNVVLPKESLPRMTIAKFMKFQERFNDASNGESGISGYFQTVDDDELVASTELVVMHSLGCSSEMRIDEIYITQPYLCIVPGVEGHYKRFGVLCERLKLPVLVLQPSIDIVVDNVREIAEKLVHVMIQSVKNRKRFYLLGYELGILIALEMAAILESYGSTGTVYCLGGTPEDIRTSSEMDLGAMSEDTLQNSLLKHLTGLLMGNNPDLSESLQKAVSLEEKIEICVNKIHGKTSYTSQFARSYLKAAYNRFELLRKQVAKPQLLKSKIVILRAKLPSSFNLNSMAGFSQQPVAVHELRTSLAKTPLDLQCAAIINKYLDPEILETFYSRNLCDTYLIKTDMLMI